MSLIEIDYKEPKFHGWTIVEMVDEQTRGITRFLKPGDHLLELKLKALGAMGMHSLFSGDIRPEDLCGCSLKNPDGMKALALGLLPVDGSNQVHNVTVYLSGICRVLAGDDPGLTRAVSAILSS